MSVQAVGAYFDRLVELRGFKMKTVCERAGVKPGYISRLLSGEIKEPSGVVLWALTREVSGSWRDIGVLLQDSASIPLGRALADNWHDEFGQQSIEEGIDEVNDTQRLLSMYERARLLPDDPPQNWLERFSMSSYISLLIDLSRVAYFERLSRRDILYSIHLIGRMINNLDREIKRRSARTTHHQEESDDMHERI